jgi:hypothetical protein
MNNTDDLIGLMEIQSLLGYRGTSNNTAHLKLFKVLKKIKIDGRTYYSKKQLKEYVLDYISQYNRVMRYIEAVNKEAFWREEGFKGRINNENELSLSQVAFLLGTTRENIRQRVNSGGIKAQTEKRNKYINYKIKISDLETYVMKDKINKRFRAFIEYFQAEEKKQAEMKDEE